MRRYSASEIRSYARCARAWWYEQHGNGPAGIPAGELEARLRQLRRSRRPDDPEVRQLEAALQQRAILSQGREVHQRHSRRVQRGLGCGALLALLGGVVGLSVVLRA